MRIIMSERKLYLAGFGGNRYETTFEELKKQAFEGKIKRKDKIIVNEVNEGQAREYVVLCGNIKGLEKYFIQGEAERAVEKRRIEEEKEAARLAREKEKEEAKARKQEEKINAQKEQAEREREEGEVKAHPVSTPWAPSPTSELILKVHGIAEEKRQGSKEGRVSLCTNADEALTNAQNSFKEANKRVSFITNFVSIINFILFIGVFSACCDMFDFSDEPVALLVISLVLIALLFLINRVVAAVLELPLEIAVFQVDALKSIIIETSNIGKKRGLDMETMKMSSSGVDEAIEPECFSLQESTSETVPVPPREI